MIEIRSAAELLAKWTPQSRPPLVIIGANAFQRPLVRRANALGYETHVFAWREGAVAAAEAAFYYPISIVDTEAILACCERIRPVGITTVGSDLAMLTAGALARRLGLPANSERCSYIASNKYAMREAFARCGVRVPAHHKVCGAQYRALSEGRRQAFCRRLLSGTESLIVKPTDRSGSRSIFRIDPAETALSDCLRQLDQALRQAMRDSFESAAIVEAFIEGAEFSCETISERGEHHVLQITEKITTAAPHYIEVAHVQPATLNDGQRAEIQREVLKGLDALEISQGASHAEFRLDREGKAHIIEIGARMGGDFIGSHLVPLSTGYDYLGLTLAAATGRPLELQAASHAAYSAVRFAFTASDLNVLKTFCSRFPDVVKEQYFSQEIHPVMDSSSRLGHVVVGTNSEETLTALLQDIPNVGK